MLRRLVTAAAALSAPGIALTIASERLIRPRIFYTGDWHPEPPDAVRHPHEEATLYTADGLELQGWFFKGPRNHDGSPPPTILFFHGTSYSASDMWVTQERATAFHDFLQGVRCNFLLFDYRGFGRNPGTATEEGTYTDGAAAIAWLYNRDDVDPATIFPYGFSLGTGIATEIATREPSAGLILRAPFTSIRDMALEADERVRLALLFAPWLPLTRYDNLSKVRRLDRPLLVMHGDADARVPERMGRRIFEAAPEPKRYVSFPGFGHSEVANDFVVPSVRQFIDDVLASAPSATDLSPAAAD